MELIYIYIYIYISIMFVGCTNNFNSFYQFLKKKKNIKKKLNSYMAKW